MNNAHARLEKKEKIVSSNYPSHALFQALTAELYQQFGEDRLAVDSYYRLSLSNNDPEIAKRATKLATETAQISRALEGAKRWVKLNPNSLEANQYLALLQLRNSHFKASAKQLDVIHQLILKTGDVTEKQFLSLQQKITATSESLKFIGAVLAAESHHKKALQVFSLYQKHYLTKSFAYQQELILANLAMKAQDYNVVLTSLGELKRFDSKNYIDAAVMKAKAFSKLHKVNQAIEILDNIKKHPLAKDSHRLELVRLLVLNKQKSRALPILDRLVLRHAKNNELLKSLIALQIDQGLLRKADKNVQKLHKIKKYRSDADYFAGELLEKRNQFDDALALYLKVNSGSYVRNGHKKIIRLTEQLKGAKALDRLFREKQGNAETQKDRAYWLKLEGDELFNLKHYEKSLGRYTQAIEIASKNTSYRYKRGLVNERLGRLDQAEADFNFVLKKRKNDVDALNALGYMLSVHTQRLDEAKKYISKAYQIKPNDPVIIDSLGYVLLKSGKLVEAERYLRKAFSLMKSPEVASHLITVLAQSNQHLEARKIYQKMYKKYPNSPSLKSVSHYLP